jgi:hypothetical protein
MGALWFLGTLGADQLRFTQICTITNRSCNRRTEHHRTRRSDRFHPMCHPVLLTNGGVTQGTRTELTVIT